VWRKDQCEILVFIERQLFSTKTYFQRLPLERKGKQGQAEPFSFVISPLVMVNTCLLYAVVCVLVIFSGMQNINPKATIFLMEYTLHKKNY